MSSKIVCIHRLDDYSGSPLVLANLIQDWVKKGNEVDLYTAYKGRVGFLSDIKGVTYFHVPYNKYSIKLFTLLYFFISQLFLFFRLLKYRNENVIFYVNTLVPFGAAIAGRLMGKKVVYHIHEVSISPQFLNSLLINIASRTASEVIFVSEYVKNYSRIDIKNSYVVYNALSEDFVEFAKSYKPDYNYRTFYVLMICSLKDFKGVYEFVKLSESLPYLNFELVLNANSISIKKAFSNTTLPSNLKIYPASKNVHDFYRRSHLLLNLSHPDKWIETFGLTVLEAMYYGKPAIVPTIGGITELVDDGHNGYQISVYNFEKLKDTISRIANNNGLYKTISQQAFKKSKEFSFRKMSNSIDNILLWKK